MVATAGQTTGNDAGLLTVPAPTILDPCGVAAIYEQFRPKHEQQETAFCLLNWRRLYELEQRLFPNQPSEILNTEDHPLASDLVIKHIASWLQRINQAYFPIQDQASELIDITADIAWPLDYIPVMPIGVHYHPPDELFCDGVLQDRGVEDLLMCLAFDEMDLYWEDEAVLTVKQTMWQLYPSTVSLPDEFELSAVVPSLIKQPPPPPFDDVAAVALMVLRNTNTCWLNLSWEDLQEGGYGLEPWDQDHLVQSLRDQWQDAQVTLEASRRLAQWCDQSDPAEQAKRCRQVVQLLCSRWQMLRGQLALPLQLENVP